MNGRQGGSLWDKYQYNNCSTLCLPEISIRIVLMIVMFFRKEAMNPDPWAHKTLGSQLCHLTCVVGLVILTGALFCYFRKLIV